MTNITNIDVQIRPHFDAVPAAQATQRAVKTAGAPQTHRVLARPCKRRLFTAAATAPGTLISGAPAAQATQRAVKAATVHVRTQEATQALAACLRV